jgi:hypothetical protein
MKIKNFHDDFLKEKFNSLKKLTAPENAVKALYNKIAETGAEREKSVEHAPRRYPVRFKIVFAVLATLMVCIPTTYLLTKRLLKAETEANTYIVKFIYESREAHTVNLVGDFNNWDKDVIKMQKIENTNLWAAEVVLNQGLYKYLFLIDGEKWKVDPISQITVKDGFGRESSLIVLLDESEEAVKL